MKTAPLAVRTFLFLAIGTLLVSCRPRLRSDVPATSAPPTVQPAPTNPTSTLPPTPPASSTLASGERAALNLARQRLAMELKVAQEEIEVLSLEAVDWPDSGLGCAPPGRHVLTVVTPGYRVVLAYGGRRYEYRSGGPTTPQPCAGQSSSQQVRRVAPGDVIEVEGELVSIGNVPFTRLAISMPEGEKFEVVDSALAAEVAQRPRERLSFRVRVVGRGKVTPIEVEILAVRP